MSMRRLCSRIHSPIKFQSVWNSIFIRFKYILLLHNSCFVLFEEMLYYFEINAACCFKAVAFLTQISSMPKARVFDCYSLDGLEFEIGIRRLCSSFNCFISHKFNLRFVSSTPLNAKRKIRLRVDFKAPNIVTISKIFAKISILPLLRRKMSGKSWKTAIAECSLGIVPHGIGQFAEFFGESADSTRTLQLLLFWRRRINRTIHFFQKRASQRSHNRVKLSVGASRDENHAVRPDDQLERKRHALASVAFAVGRRVQLAYR